MLDTLHSVPLTDPVLSYIIWYPSVDSKISSGQVAASKRIPEG